MTTNNFKALTAADFALVFKTHAVEVIFDAANTKWNVVGEGEPWVSTSYANALVHLMLNTYSFQPSDGIFMRKTWDEISLSPEKDDDLGYVMGFALSALLKDGTLTYRSDDDVVPTNMYRVAYDGWLSRFVRRVDYIEYDKDEPKFAGHNRNAWKIVRDLSILRKSRDMGYNVRMLYTDDMTPYFEQAFALEFAPDGMSVVKAEGGLNAKYQLYKEGKVDVIRKLIAAQIANRNLAKTIYKAGRKEIEAKKAYDADENPEKGEFVSPVVVKSTTWQLLNALTQEPVDLKTLAGRHIQFHSFIGTNPKIWTVVDGEVSDIPNGKMTVANVCAAAKANGCAIVFSDVAPAPRKARKAGRFTNDPQPL